MNLPPFPSGERPRAARVADWVELSALARSQPFKQGDLRAATQREDLANPELTAANTWNELRKRSGHLKERWPLRLSDTRLTRRRPSPINLGLYRFMCLFGLGTVDESDRQLFEEVAAHLIEPLTQKSGLRIGHPASEGMSSHFNDRVQHYIKNSNIVEWEVQKPLPTSDMDFGLDVVSWYGFADNRGGDLHFLVQVATGYDWSEKLHDIDLENWKDHLHWGVPPVRIFVTPLVISLSQTKWIRTVRAAGVMLDRPRLCELAQLIDLPNSLKVEVTRRSRHLLEV